MNDEMNDLAPALLMTVIIAIGIVAFEFRSVLLATPAHASTARIEKSRIDKSRSDKAGAQAAIGDRLYWIR